MTQDYKNGSNTLNKNLTEKALTDQAIARLFLNIYQDYEDEKKQHANDYSKMYEALQLSMFWEFEFGVLVEYNESSVAKEQAHSILNTLLRLRHNQNTGLDVSKFEFQLSFTRDFMSRTRDYSEWERQSRRWFYSSRRQDSFTNLLLWSVFSSSGSRGWASTRTGSSNSSDSSDCFAKIVALLLIIAAVIAVFIATYFIIKYLVESMERFSYNEGFFDAVAPIAGMLAGGAVAGVASSLLLMGTLTALAVAAGIPPLGFAIAIIVALSLIGAVIGGVIAKQSKEYANTKLHADSLNPNDPHRFRLTPSEIKNLERQDYDPIKVKCAIVDLMKKMGTAKVSHLFFRNEDTQDILDKVRALRAGNISRVYPDSSTLFKKDNASQASVASIAHPAYA